jgi:hypothetical protein
MKMEENDHVSLLEQNRPLILLTEIIGFLHDLGKLDNKCYEKHNERIRTEFGIDNPNPDIKILSRKYIPEVVFNLFARTNLKEAFVGKVDNEILDFLSQRVNSKGSKYESPTVGSPIFYHHEYRKTYSPRNVFEKIIAKSDSQDSNEDRGACEAESLDHFFISTPFGYEEELDEKIKANLEFFGVKDRTECREHFYRRLGKIIEKMLISGKFRVEDNSWLDFRKEFYEIAQMYFPLSLAETRRPGNDINLYDHCYMTGSLAKTVISNIVLSREFRQAVESMERYEFKLLIVGFRGYEFLFNVSRLPDFIGRRNILEKVTKNIRKCVEFDIPLGNLIYEDMNTMCFLLPAFQDIECEMSVKKELKKLITGEFLKGTNGILFPYVEILGDNDGRPSKYIGPLIETAKEIIEEKARIPYLEIEKLPWMDEWKNTWMCLDCGTLFERAENRKCPKCNSDKIKKREICFVCGYAPEYPVDQGIISAKGERLCHFCHSTRVIGINERMEENNETLWLDELRDEENRIALIVGKITPIEKWLSGDLIRKTTRNLFVREYDNLAREGKQTSAGKVKRLDKAMGTVGAIFGGKIDDSETGVFEGVKEKLKINPRATEYFEAMRKKYEGKKPTSNRIKETIDELKRILSEKSGSPSRLRRVWKELLQFSEDCEEHLKHFLEEEGLERKRLVIEVNEDLGKKRHLLGSAEISGINIGSVICEGSRTVITSNYLDSKLDGKLIDEHNKEELKSMLVGASLDVEWNDGSSSSLEIKRIMEIQNYMPIVPVYKTTGEFMLLCPASYAISFSRIIERDFFKRYNKSLGKLNLNIGLVYFKYKEPLYLILDTGKRLLNEFKSDQLQKEVKYSLKKESKEVMIEKLNWRIRPFFSDGSEDRYYSLFKNAQSGEYVPILSFENADEVMLTTNHFDYEYFESSQKRFEVILDEKNVTRTHPKIGKFGPRPYLLEDLEGMCELWTILDPESGRLSSSQARNLEYLCANKILEWDLGRENISEDDLFRKFVRSSVRNICGETLSYKDKDDIIQSIISGSFFDTLELFMTLRSKEVAK